jgi:hypothetical protein
MALAYIPSPNMGTPPFGFLMLPFFFFSLEVSAKHHTTNSNFSAKQSNSTFKFVLFYFQSQLKLVNYLLLGKNDGQRSK